jgi:hypothetical protein|tara:strand:+ start:104 stop:331 length:228 start_codon:yes stop_codon:yes gene_type:complete
MKKIKLLVITFMFPLILMNCSNQYDGGIYTGSSMSSKKPTEQDDQEIQVIEEKLTSETISTQSSDQEIENEDNYK